MGTLTAPEIRECSLSPEERAQARDSFVRSFERQWADWTAIAQVCLEVERDQDYLLLGFHSWHAWLLEAAPRSRSYIYAACGRLTELLDDYSKEELAAMPLGTASIAIKLPRSVRRDPKVRATIKAKPKEFLDSLRHSHPEQLMESVVEKKLRFTLSQWQIIDAAFEKYRLVDDTATLEVFFEWCVSEQSS